MSYTLNASSGGDKRQLVDIEDNFKSYVRYLVHIGVATVTVTLPLFAKWIREVDASIGIEVSTIANVDTVSKIANWNSRYGINGVCAPIAVNRDISLLKGMANYCRSADIELAIMVNEFCGNGIDGQGVDYSGCIFRDSCYVLHSLGYDNGNQLEGYPLSLCAKSRSDAAHWLKTPFIRPEDVQRYADIGIGLFKILGGQRLLQNACRLWNIM